MSTKVTIWDLQANDLGKGKFEPAPITLWSVDAEEAIRNGKGRYVRAKEVSVDVVPPPVTEPDLSGDS